MSESDSILPGLSVINGGLQWIFSQRSKPKQNRKKENKSPKRFELIPSTMVMVTYTQENLL